jgi:metal-responsive CopG/Arc/MetJ family transcriptional regulator
MQTVISIPDDLFAAARPLARKTKKSLSRLFTDALQEYLTRHRTDQVTKAMNNALVKLGAAEVHFDSTSAGRILERSDW